MLRSLRDGIRSGSRSPAGADDAPEGDKIGPVASDGPVCDETASAKSNIQPPHPNPGMLKIT